MLSLSAWVAAAADDTHFPATPSPEHAARFAPPGQAERYQFLVTEVPIDEVAAFYARRAPQGSGRHFVVGPGVPDAFDSLARFNRFRLAQLYGGRAPRVARGPVPRASGSREVAAVVLLMSPYPEPDLGVLNPGTLIMVVSVAGASNPDRPRP